MPVSNIDSVEISYSNSLLSPKDEIILQGTGQELEIAKDNTQFKKMLTKIEESEDEEESSDSLRGDPSITSEERPVDEGEEEVPKFIMGQDFIPKIERQNKM